jgi:hypothetical protein
MFAWDSQSQAQHRELRLAVRQAKLLEQQIKLEAQQMQSQNPLEDGSQDSSVKPEAASLVEVKQESGLLLPNQQSPLSALSPDFKQEVEPSPRKRGRPKQVKTVYEEEEVIDEEEEQLNMEKRDLPNGEVDVSIIIHGISPKERFVGC